MQETQRTRESEPPFSSGSLVFVAPGPGRESTAVEAGFVRALPGACAARCHLTRRGARKRKGVLASFVPSSGGRLSWVRWSVGAPGSRIFFFFFFIPFLVFLLLAHGEKPSEGDW